MVRYRFIIYCTILPIYPILLNAAYHVHGLDGTRSACRACTAVSCVLLTGRAARPRGSRCAIRPCIALVQLCLCIVAYSIHTSTHRAAPDRCFNMLPARCQQIVPSFPKSLGTPGVLELDKDLKKLTNVDLLSYRS